jgi:hypothetical protein
MHIRPGGHLRIRPPQDPVVFAVLHRSPTKLTHGRLDMPDACTHVLPFQPLPITV